MTDVEQDGLVGEQCLQKLQHILAGRGWIGKSMLPCQCRPMRILDLVGRKSLKPRLLKVKNKGNTGMYYENRKVVDRIDKLKKSKLLLEYHPYLNYS